MNDQGQERQNKQKTTPLTDGTKELEVVGVEEIKSNGQVPAGKKDDAPKSAPETTRFEIINVNEILQFINSSLNAQKVGVLNGDKAFTMLIDMLNKSIKPM